MSQTCDAIQLVVFDADCILDETLAAALEAVIETGTRLGALSGADDVAQRVSASPSASSFDFWLPGIEGNYPFARLLALIDIEPGRVLFVSTRTDASDQAREHGLRTAHPQTDDLSRLLG